MTIDPTTAALIAAIEAAIPNALDLAEVDSPSRGYDRGPAQRAAQKGEVIPMVTIKGGTCTLRVRNTVKSLQDLAKRLGAIIKTRRPCAARAPAAASPHITARALLKEGARQESIDAIEGRGAVFFGSGPNVPQLYQVAEQITIEGRAWVIGRAVSDGTIVALHAASGLAAQRQTNGQLAPTRSVSACLAWLDQVHADDTENGYHGRLIKAIEQAADFDQTAARAAFLAVEGTQPAHEREAADVARAAYRAALPIIVQPAAAAPVAPSQTRQHRAQDRSASLTHRRIRPAMPSSRPQFAKRTYRPLDHLGSMATRYPGAWQHLDTVRARESAAWPAWCFAPIAAAAGFASSADDAARLAALAAWRMTQGIYRFNANAMPAAALEQTQCAELYRLPEWCVYLEFPAMPGDSLRVCGAFAHLDHAPDSTHTTLRLVLDTVQGLQPVSLSLEGGSLWHALERAPPAQTAAASPGLIAQVLAMLAQVCTRSSITGPGSNPRRPANPTPVRTRGEWRLFAAHKPTVWQVGCTAP